MIAVFEEFQGPVLAIEEVPWVGEQLRHHRRRGNQTRAFTRSATWWKTGARRGPLNLAIIGRYIDAPDIFPILEATAVTAPARSSSAACAGC